MRWEENDLKLIWLLLVTPLAAFAQATPPPAKATPPVNGGYVGSAVCKGCHPDVWMNFPKNPHFKSVASGTETPEHTGCEGCHGPGAAHVKAGGGKTTIPHAFSLMQPGEIVNDCLECHAKDISRANIRRSVHTDADVVCASCHSIHKPQTPKFLLAKVQKDLCYQCHATVRAQFDMPVKHRVNEGVIQCSDCHNPHGTFATTWRTGVRPRMVDQAAGGEEACIKCHQDKRGPFVFEHAVIRIEGCEACHNPHGSTNSKLLKRPVVFTLCLECHNGAGNFGRNTTGVLAQSSAHNMLDPRFQNCTNCHVRLHGSNADAYFLR
jgi:DmsE family decaheme c-type cytochrome